VRIVPCGWEFRRVWIHLLKLFRSGLQTIGQPHDLVDPEGGHHGALHGIEMARLDFCIAGLVRSLRLAGLDA